jgi:lysyl-tRNA synthetase class 2
MMEFYEAYSDYRMLMDFTEGLLRHAAQEALGTTCFQYQGRELDLGKPFERLTIVEAIRKYRPGFSEAQCHASSPAAWARCSCSCSSAPPKPSCGTRPSSSTTRRK